jgi:formiminotetrahydrofolate cyclodeaminase
MNEFKIETPEERRERYLRLARAAADAAAKIPTPAAREMYLQLARSWAAVADEHDATVADEHFATVAADFDPDDGDSIPHSGEPAQSRASLNGKLNPPR